MILYFSGTGNSKYVADFIADKINDEIVSLFDKIKDNDYSEISSATPFIICCPTYCWQIPHIVRDWLTNANLIGSNKIYFVMTCGGEIGNSEKYLRLLCKKIGKEYMGCAEIVMPENYIAMFTAPDDKQAQEIIASAEKKLESVVKIISSEDRLEAVKVNLIGKLYSSIVNDVFYPLFVKDKKFTVSDDCIGCGLCEKKCVMNNISIVDNKPVWNGNCTHCMACICYCPKEAIEYGRHSRGLIRYTCKEYKKSV